MKYRKELLNQKYKNELINENAFVEKYGNT